MKKIFATSLGFMAIIYLLFATLAAHAAVDMSGIHKFFNDDRNHFVDLWHNTNGQITIKVSNGRPLKEMWVVVHATFMSGATVLGTKDYHVYCMAPSPGASSNEKWFVFHNPGFTGVTDIVISTNKERKWEDPKDGWELPITGRRSY